MSILQTHRGQSCYYATFSVHVTYCTVDNARLLFYFVSDVYSAYYTYAKVL